MNDDIGKPEYITQKRVIKFFRQKLKYDYIGNLKKQENKNIDEEKLKTWLKSKGYSTKVCQKAVEELLKVSNNLRTRTIFS